jgi:hypothetical protein
MKTGIKANRFAEHVDRLGFPPLGAEGDAESDVYVHDFGTECDRFPKQWLGLVPATLLDEDETKRVQRLRISAKRGRSARDLLRSRVVPSADQRLAQGHMCVDVVGIHADRGAEVAEGLFNVLRCRLGSLGRCDEQ